MTDGNDGAARLEERRDALKMLRKLASREEATVSQYIDDLERRLAAAEAERDAALAEAARYKEVVWAIRAKMRSALRADGA